MLVWFFQWHPMGWVGAWSCWKSNTKQWVVLGHTASWWQQGEEIQSCSQSFKQTTRWHLKRTSGDGKYYIIIASSVNIFLLKSSFSFLLPLTLLSPCDCLCLSCYSVGHWNHVKHPGSTCKICAVRIPYPLYWTVLLEKHNLCNSHKLKSPPKQPLKYLSMPEHPSEVRTLVADISAYDLWNVPCPVLTSAIL